MLKALLISTLLVYLSASQTPSKVLVEFFVMSKCPYAAGLVQNFHDNVYTSSGLPDITNIQFNYIAQWDGSGFQSKHGPSEVQGDFYELCVQQTAPEKLFPFVYCNDQDYQSIPTEVTDCGSKVGINWQPVSACFTNQAPALLNASIAITNARGVAYSPNLFVAGQCLYGTLPNCVNVDPTSNQIREAICKAYQGTQPAGCASFDNVIEENAN